MTAGTTAPAIDGELALGQPRPPRSEHGRSAASHSETLSSWDIAEAAAAAAAAASAAADGKAVSVWRPPPEVKLIVDPSLSILARKLRM
eukprot:5588540-Prymnesium_polylepis.1